MTRKKAVWNLLKDTFNAWNDDRAPRLAAALAYYTIFALAPLLLIAIAVAAFFFDEAQVRQNMLSQVGELVGDNGRQAIEAMIEGARKPATGLIATAVGLLTLAIAAGGFFNQLQDALNTIWGVQPKPGRGIWGIVRDRFLSFSMVLVCGLVLLASLIVSAALSAASQFMGEAVGRQAWLWQSLNLAVSFAVTTLLFAMIFKVLPDAKIRWRDVWIGAAATAALFSLGRFLIGWYLGQAATESTYGAAGSLVALLIWIYYSTQILFLGAEFTQIYAQTYGARIEPAANAVAVAKETRAQPAPGETVSATKIYPAPALAALSRQPPAPAAARAPVSAAIVGFAAGLFLGRRL